MILHKQEIRIITNMDELLNLCKKGIITSQEFLKISNRNKFVINDSEKEIIEKLKNAENELVELIIRQRLGNNKLIIYDSDEAYETDNDVNKKVLALFNDCYKGCNIFSKSYDGSLGVLIVDGNNVTWEFVNDGDQILVESDSTDFMRVLEFENEKTEKTESTVKIISEIIKECHKIALLSDRD